MEKCSQWWAIIQELCGVNSSGVFGMGQLLACELTCGVSWSQDRIGIQINLNLFSR